MDNNNFNITSAVEKLVQKDGKITNSCPSEKFPEDTTPTMAYIPYQLDRTSYSTEEALQNGTLFTVLNKPFTGGISRE